MSKASVDYRQALVEALRNNEEEQMLYLKASDHVTPTAEVVALEKDIQNWNDKYDKDVKHDGPSPGFDWENFHKEGIMLAKKVKNIMGPNGKVIYFKEAEYSSTEESKEILIQD